MNGGGFSKNTNYPFELLRDIIDQCGFMDQPYFHADGWKLNEDTSAKLDCPTFQFTYSGGKDAIPLGWHMRATKVRNK